MRHCMAGGIPCNIDTMNVQSIILLVFLLIVAAYATYNRFFKKGGGKGDCDGNCSGGCGGCCG